MLIVGKRRPSPPYNPGVGDLVRAKRQWSPQLDPVAVKQGFRGWHERGYLPHRDEPGFVQFVTFRLADSFPLHLRAEWEPLLKIEEETERRRKLEEYLDKGRGECLLRRPRVARLVEESLLCRHEVDYDLRAWVIMPNHVHVLFQVQSVPMSQILDAWKGFTAKAINKVLGRRGKIWLDDYWDTYMRDLEHEHRARRYIENNPTKVGLVACRRDWPWSSSRHRDAYERLCLLQRTAPVPGAET